MGESALENGLETTAQLESTPQGLVKRWVAELDIATNAEKDWRKDGDDNWKLYKSEKKSESTFNILWSNTETLRPALYNSLPEPDVRRRFRDKDPVGKAASEVLERGIKYSIDLGNFDKHIKDSVLDVLIVGRGVARVKYVPTLRDQAGYEPDPLSDEEPPQEIAEENATIEHVKWDDFRRGPGKCWTQVPWQAFGHDMPFDQLVEYFGQEMAEKIPLSNDERDKDIKDKTTRSLLKVARIWEIWDRVTKRVIFICEQYKHGPLREPETDPLRLKDFFPAPEPCYAIEDTTSLIPQPPYQKYEEQARELNKVSKRINKIVDALKVRGGYSANLTELASMIEATDNQMIPIVNASEIAAMGGLDKAIWIMPIDKLAGVLKELYASRRETLQTIYEITGLGDIMRGVSNPHETLGAQQLKSQWGTLRLQRLQREVQRFIRDLMRLVGEILAEHFQPESLQEMTGIELPSAQEKAQLQMMAQQAMASGQQVPPEVQAEAQKILASPTWEDVMSVLRSDKMRCYHVDIETDSTVAETLTRDAQGMQEAITAVVNLFNGLAPAIESGALSVEVAKGIALAMARQARMGDAVEEAIEQIQQPPPPKPEDQPQDLSVEVAKIRAQSAAELEQFKAQTTQQLETMRQNHETQKTQLVEQNKTAKTESDAASKRFEALLQQSIAKMQEDNKLLIAQMQAQTDARIADMQIKSDERVAAAREESQREIAKLNAHNAEKDREASNDNNEKQRKADAETAKAKSKD